MRLCAHGCSRVASHCFDVCVRPRKQDREHSRLPEAQRRQNLVPQLLSLQWKDNNLLGTLPDIQLLLQCKEMPFFDAALVSLPASGQFSDVLGKFRMTVPLQDPSGLLYDLQILRIECFVMT